MCHRGIQLYVSLFTDVLTQLSRSGSGILLLDSRLAGSLSQEVGKYPSCALFTLWAHYFCSNEISSKIQTRETSDFKL